MEVDLGDFLAEAGLAGYEVSLRECGLRSANQILRIDNPLSLLSLSSTEQQRFIRALVELRRRVCPPLPLPPGKDLHFYIIHSRRSFAEPLLHALQDSGASVFTHQAVTYRRTTGSISRWHQPPPGFSPRGKHREAPGFPPRPDQRFTVAHT
jgi:hypothetical protein